MARKLQEVFINNAFYFVDWRLLQIRKVDNPHDYINFTSVKQMINYLERGGDYAF